MTGPIVTTEDKYGTHTVECTKSAVHETSTLPEVDTPVVEKDQDRYPSFISQPPRGKHLKQTYVGEKIESFHAMETSSQAAAQKKPRRVAIAVDGSKHSDTAFQWYCENLHQPNDILYILTVCQLSVDVVYPMAGGFTGVYAMDDIHEQEKDKARECVRRYGKKATEKNIPHILEMAIGSPDDQITNFCDHYDMDLLVVGSRGHGMFKRWFLGSTSEYTVNHVHCPVVVVRESEKEKEKEKKQGNKEEETSEHKVHDKKE